MPWGPELRPAPPLRAPQLLAPQLLAPLLLALLLPSTGCAARSARLDPGLPAETAAQIGASSEGAEAGRGALVKARAQVEAAAGDLEAGLRGRALQVLVELGEPAARPAYLQRALWDPNPGVQRQVARAVAQDPAHRPALLAFLARAEVPAATRCLVARELLAPGLERAELLGALGLAPSAAAVTACQLLAAEGGDPLAAEALRQALSRGSLRLDMDLVLALATSPLPGLGDAMEAGLDRVDELARGPAGLILLGQDHPRGAQVLRQALTGPDPIAAMEAVDLLLLLDRPAAAELLAQARGAADPRLDLYARLAGAAFGDPDPRALRELAAREDGELVALGLGALGLGLERRPQDPELRRIARRAAREFASAEGAQVQVAVAGLVGDLGEPELLALLRWGEDPEAPLRLRLAIAQAVLQVDRATRRDEARPAQSPSAARNGQDEPGMGLSGPVPPSGGL